MARTGTVRLGSGIRINDLISLGALTAHVSMAEVHQVLAETGRASERQRDLPAHVMVYYVIALSLYRSDASREVLRVLLEGLKDLLGLAVPLEPAGKSGISQARTRLGEEPLKELYRKVVRPIATEQTQGAFYRGRRVVAADGTTLEVPDTPANREAFGLPYSGKGESAYPRLRVVGLVETGTHVLFGAAQGSYSTGEVTLAWEVLKHLRPGMLCLADRYFYGYALWNQARDTGADLLWRVRRNIRLPCEERLPDGSYLTRVYEKRDALGRGIGEGVVVRVIEYTVLGRKGKPELYRLITTILDPEAAPAEELAQLYLERWEFETTLDEFKTHMRGASTVLRSMKPDLVRQEVWGLLLAHFALRGLMHESALRGKQDPDRISFTHTVNVVRRTLPRFAVFPPRGLEKAARGRARRNSPGAPATSAQAKRQARGEAKAEQASGEKANRQVTHPSADYPGDS
jgi:Transposase DDE domain.